MKAEFLARGIPGDGEGADGLGSTVLKSPEGDEGRGNGHAGVSGN